MQVSTQGLLFNLDHLLLPALCLLFLLILRDFLNNKELPVRSQFYTWYHFPAVMLLEAAAGCESAGSTATGSNRISGLQSTLFDQTLQASLMQTQHWKTSHQVSCLCTNHLLRISGSMVSLFFSFCIAESDVMPSFKPHSILNFDILNWLALFDKWCLGVLFKYIHLFVTFCSALSKSRPGENTIVIYNHEKTKCTHCFESRSTCLNTNNQNLAWVHLIHPEH